MKCSAEFSVNAGLCFCSVTDVPGIRIRLALGNPKGKYDIRVMHGNCVAQALTALLKMCTVGVCECYLLREYDAHLDV